MPIRRDDQSPDESNSAMLNPVTFDMVREIAFTLDGVEEGTSYGTPAFRVHGALFARLREDLDSLVVRMDFEQREELMAADSETYYITDHYLNYQWMLIRLSRVHPDALRELLRMAWGFASKHQRGTTQRQRSRLARTTRVLKH